MTRGLKPKGESSINMRKSIRFYAFFLLMFFVVSARPCLAADAAAAKKNLVSYISNEIKELDQQAAHPYESQRFILNSEEAKKEEKVIRESLAVERKKLSNMLSLVQAQSEEKLPTVLVDYYVDENLSWEKYPNNLGQYIQILGEVSVPAIDARFDHASSRIKTYLLSMLGAIHSPKSMPIIRRALMDDSKDVILAALKAWHETGPEVEKMLADSKGKWTIKEPDLKNAINPSADPSFYLSGDNEWYDALLSFSEAKKVTFYDLSMIVNFSEFPEAVVGRHIPFLLTLVDVKNSNSLSERTLAAQLLTKITDPGQVKQLSPLIVQLIPERYREGGVIENYEDYPRTPVSKSPFSYDQIVTVTDRIANVLTVPELQDLLTRNSTQISMRVYLQNLLDKKTGTPAAVIEKSLNLRIDVFDSSGAVISSGTYNLALNQEQKVILPAGANAFPEHQLKITPRLDPAKGMFYLNPIFIDFKPSAAMLDAYLPFHGANQIKFRDFINGQPQEFQWKFSHI